MSSDVIYLRKSRMEANSDTDETLARHKKTLLEFAERSGLTIVRIYEEVVSGETLYARPEMLRLLSDLDEQQFDAVLCMDIDRLGRSSMSDQGIILETLKRNGTRIITPRKVYDLSNDIDETYSEFESFMARQELKIIKRRLHNGIRRTVNDGGYIANAPYGYTKTVLNKVPTLAINDDEAVFVRMIFDMYVNQGVGGQIIADTLHTLGARPHRAQRFGRTSIASILRNSVYIGKVTWDKKKHIRKGAHGNEKHVTVRNDPANWTVVDGLHPPIIDETMFTRAQEILGGRYHPPCYKGIVENPLAGLVVCGNCGSVMQRQHIHRGSAREWESILCVHKGCIPSVKLAYLEASVITHLQRRLAELAVELKHERHSTADAAAIETALNTTRQDLATLERQRGNLHDLLEQGVYDIETYLERARLLNEKTTELTTREAAQLTALEKLHSQSKRALHTKIKSVLQAYAAANAAERNMMLKSVIQKVVYNRAAKSQPHNYTVSVEMREV